MKLTKKQMISVVKAMGNAIVKNAEDIVGNSETLSDVTVSFTVESNMDSAPMLDITRTMPTVDFFNYVISNEFEEDGREENGAGEAM